MPKITLLDCSLRDGGYYTNWDFEPDLVSSYLHSMELSKVDAIELGFRYLQKDRFLGAFAYCSDEFLADLPLPAEALIGVMVNAKELLEFPDGYLAAIDKLFHRSNQSRLDFVRVATHLENASECKAICDRLKELGYMVTINLMQVANKERSMLSQIASDIDSWGSVDILYFADSFGGIDEKETMELTKELLSRWSGKIGIHAHDNMGRAMANTLVAMDSGAKWLDSTVLGIGRGAGNTKTELMLLELSKRGLGNYSPNAVFPLVMDDFTKLQKKYKWGTNLLYYLSALYNVHPTYVQEMLGQKRYDTHHILSVLEYLKNSSAGFYNQDNLEQAVIDHAGSSEGSWSVEGWAKGKDILIIGAGHSVKTHLPAIIRYVDAQNPLVLCLNVNDFFPADKITAYAACHKARIFIEADKYKNLSKPIFLPLGVAPESVIETLNGAKVYDFGMKIEKDRFDVTSTSCVIPFPMVLAYVMALSVASGARRLLLAGFDGYEPSDPRQITMEKLLHIYSKFEKALPLLAVTPSTYSMPQSSIYSPHL